MTPAQRIYDELESIGKAINNESNARNRAMKSNNASAVALSEMYLNDLRKHRAALRGRLPKKKKKKPVVRNQWPQ